MKNQFSLILCTLFLISGCGGGGSPMATLSATTLTFNGEVKGTTSPAQSVTLSNSGTATLNIASIVASANFGETNTCGSALTAGATCNISVTFSPGAAGNVTGTLSVTDNAGGSPHNVTLSGTGISETLNGSCFQAGGPPPGCHSTLDPADCPPGQPAKNPGFTSCGGNGPIYIDSGSHCLVGGRSSGGDCEVTPP